MLTENEYINNAAGSFSEAASGLLTTLGRFDENGFNRSPSYGGWSAGEVGEHLLKSYGLAQTMNGKVQPARRPTDKNIAEIKSVFLNYEIRMNSPEAILPSADPKEQTVLLKALSERISEIKTVIDTKDMTVLCLDYEMPVLGALTRLEWIYFCIFHTIRHIRQLEKIIRDQEQMHAVSGTRSS